MSNYGEQFMVCPMCGGQAECESVDVGVGLYLKGDYTCACGWEEGGPLQPEVEPRPFAPLTKENLMQEIVNSVVGLIDDLGTRVKKEYVVEACWPDDMALGRYKQYYADSYCLMDDPGNGPAKRLVHRFPDLLVNCAAPNTLRFYKYSEAKTVAYLLEQKGRIASGWDGEDEWHLKKREPIKTRVVLEYVTTHRELMP